MASRLLQVCRSKIILPVSRTYASHAGPSAHAEHAGGVRRWKLMSLLVAVPGVGICWLNAYQKEKEHHEHYERPEFVAYDHLRLRSKAYPWGDGNHTLFHNKAINALPTGYED